VRAHVVFRIQMSRRIYSMVQFLRNEQRLSMEIRIIRCRLFFFNKWSRASFLSRFRRRRRTERQILHTVFRDSLENEKGCNQDRHKKSTTRKKRILKNDIWRIVLNQTWTRILSQNEIEIRFVLEKQKTRFVLYETKSVTPPQKRLENEKSATQPQENV